MPIQKGDFILVDYVGTVKETGDVFDTTKEEVARNEKLYKEGEIYEPKLVVVGEAWVLKALDEGLLNLKVKKTGSVEIPSQKAFGPRDPEKVRLVPLRRLTARGVTPKIGMRIEYDKKLATVRTVGSGRVQLDFNPPLAGKTLVYEVAIKKKLETRPEKIAALIHRRIPTVNVEKFDFKVRKASIVVHVPDEAFYLEGLQLAKRGLATDIQKFFPEATKVRFIEEYATKPASRTKK